MEYLEKRSQIDATFQYEVIIVSDGSKDSTVEVALQYAKKYTSDKVRVLNLVKNRGKGGAVRFVSFSFFIGSNANFSIPTIIWNKNQSKFIFLGDVEYSWSSNIIR